MTDQKSPLTLLIEALLFAPIGAALLAKEHLPKLAADGRQHAESRVRMARMVGDFAVKTAKKEIERRFASASTGAPTTTVAPDSGPGTTAASTSSAGAATPDLSLDEPANTEPVTTEPTPSVDELAIPGYDSLAASQVVERLNALSPEELSLIRRYEAAMRHRRTILHRIDQLVS